MATYWCEHALVGGAVASDVLVEVDGARIARVAVGAGPPPAGAHVRRGLTLPGFANSHSHAFHRALRHRTQAGRGSFWTWRDVMYTVANALDPDSYYRLARATFAEMALAGVAVVGEFHYVHHRPGGSRYDDPNAMGAAVLRAAHDAGVRITLLDTLYLRGGLSGDAGGGHKPLSPMQQRFSDGSVDGWCERVSTLRAGGPEQLIGAAVHSVRAVDRASLPPVASWAAASGVPVHAHVSEQPAENEQCLAAYGCTPTALLAGAGLLRPRFTAVHATHVTDADVALLGAHGAGACLCPTTERDLADGIGPSRRLTDAGVSLSLGTDSHAVIDLFEEARAVELDERLASGERGGHDAASLLAMATRNGHRALGWNDGGELRAGAWADLVTITLDSVRTAGATAATALEAAVFAATAADITHVVVSGRPVVEDGAHVSIDVAGELRAAIAAVVDP